MFKSSINKYNGVGKVPFLAQNVWNGRGVVYRVTEHV